MGQLEESRKQSEELRQTLVAGSSTQRRMDQELAESRERIKAFRMRLGLEDVGEVEVDRKKPYAQQREQLEDNSVAPGTVGYTTMEFTVDDRMTDAQFKESMERHAEGRAVQSIGPTSSHEIGFKTYAVRFGVHLDSVRIER